MLELEYILKFLVKKSKNFSVIVLWGLDNQVRKLIVNRAPTYIYLSIYIDINVRLK